jgi:hypothetical protein
MIDATIPGDEIPMPARPGTRWNPDPPNQGGYLRCTNCGKEWNSHGAPEDIARAFNVPNNERHTICPASDDAWAEYWRLRRRAGVDAFVADVLKDLRRFDGIDQNAIVVGIVDGFNGK